MSLRNRGYFIKSEPKMPRLSPETIGKLGGGMPSHLRRIADRLSKPDKHDPQHILVQRARVMRAYNSMMVRMLSLLEKGKKVTSQKVDKEVELHLSGFELSPQVFRRDLSKFGRAFAEHYNDVDFG